MKELYNFYSGKTITLGELPEIPTTILKKWVEDFKQQDEIKTFEEYVEDNSWMIVDSGYKKTKDYDVFYIDPKDPTSLFGNSEKVTHDFIKEYFRPLFNRLFLEANGEYNTKKLQEWVKSVVEKSKRDAYMGMIERAEYDFKISKLYNIAKALDVDICELFDFKE